MEDLEYRKGPDGSINTQHILLTEDEDMYYNLKNGKIYRGGKQMSAAAVASLKDDNPTVANTIDFITEHKEDIDRFVGSGGRRRPRPKPVLTSRPEAEDEPSHAGSPRWPAWLHNEDDDGDSIPYGDWRESGDDTGNPSDSHKPQDEDEFQPLNMPQGESGDGLFKGILSGLLSGASLAFQHAKRAAGASVQQSKSETADSARRRRRPEAVQRRRQTVRRPRRAEHQHEVEPSDNSAWRKALEFAASKLLTIAFFAVIAIATYVTARMVGAPYLSAKWWAGIAFGLCLLAWAVGSLGASVYQSGKSTSSQEEVDHVS